MPIEYRTVVVHVRTRAGTFHLVAAEGFGAYAVHLRFVDGSADGPGWAVTHRASGLCVWSVATRADAERVAAWLCEHRPFPENAGVETLFTLVGTDDALRCRLYEELPKIAPKYFHRVACGRLGERGGPMMTSLTRWFGTRLT